MDPWGELEATDFDSKGTTSIADELRNTLKTRSPKKPHDANLVSLHLLSAAEHRFINATRFLLEDCSLPIIATQAPLDPRSYGEVDTRGGFW
jgi:hypothetical protein